MACLGMPLGKHPPAMRALSPDETPLRIHKPWNSSQQARLFTRLQQQRLRKARPLSAELVH